MTPTELAAASAPSATPLAALIGSADPSRDLAEHCGSLTPRELDAPEAETSALTRGAAVHDLGWIRRVEVRGEDRFRWLSGMVTNTVNDLSVNSGAWNLVLNAQGRILGDLWVWRDEESLEMEIADDQQDKLLAHLNRFIIMDDVELAPLEEMAAVGLTGPLANDVLARAGLPALEEPLTQARVEWNGLEVRLRRSFGVLAPHYELWVPAPGLDALWQALRQAGATPVGVAALDAFRIAEGIPAYGADIMERDLAQETSQTRALSFTKGCYLGQEIVERIRSRGNVHRHLRQLELTGPVPESGTELFLADPSGRAENAEGERKAAGQIRSAAVLKSSRRVFALGMMRAEAELGEKKFTYTCGSASGTARILAAPPIFEP
jgi:folate-binding protein YgfZ